MPEPTFLQIQGGGESTTRMIELPPGPVRIGRAPHCEVQLSDPRLGDVHCMLRRRGTTWHFQPVGPSGHVWIDGRLVDQQRPIALGVQFRIGEHWLVLRPADSAVNDWGTFDAPIEVEPQAVVEAETRTLALPTAKEKSTDGQARPRPTPTPSPDDNEERLRRWEARLEHRERWLKDRQEERRWEARWKSAGETLRARSTPTTAKAPTTHPKPTPAPVRPQAPSPGTPRRPSQTPPVARIIEPKRSEPIRRVAEPPPRPPAPRVVIRPMPDPPTPIPRPVPASPVRVEHRPLEAERTTPPVTRPEPPLSPPSRAIVMLAPASAPLMVPTEAPVEVVEASTPEIALEMAPVEVDRPELRSIEEIEPAEFFSPLPQGEGPGVRGVASPAAPEPVFSDSPGLALPLAQDRQEKPCPTEEPDLLESNLTCHAPHPSPLREGEGARGVHEAEARRSPPTYEPVEAVRESETEPQRQASSLIESTSWLEETLPIAIEEARQAEIAPLAVEPEIKRPARTEPPATELPREIGRSRGEWPSAQAIFAAQPRRPSPEPRLTKDSRRKSADPEPTELLGPPCWSMPLWLGLLPVLVTTVVVGIGGIALASEWAIEANNANVAIRLAMRPEGSPGSTIDPALIPRGPWWSSTATHQAAWAMALVRAGDGEDHSEDIRALLDSSRNASRLAARTKFVVDLPEANAPGSSPDLSHLGRTRDIVTLVWTGRRLRKEGKVDSAIRAYRSAMEIASKTNLADLDPPAFFEDPQVRRYPLPREALLGFVAKAMAEDGEWTREQWAEALPPSATASLVASRVLAQMQKRADADRLADLAIRQAESPTPSGYDPAEDRAAGAEALAYRGRWTDAAEQYRRAIDQAEDDATRRMWWLNLAEVAQRVGDNAGRVRAIEAAKSPSSTDEITRRALRYQQSLTGLDSASSAR